MCMSQIWGQHKNAQQYFTQIDCTCTIRNLYLIEQFCSTFSDWLFNRISSLFASAIYQLGVGIVLLVTGQACKVLDYNNYASFQTVFTRVYMYAHEFCLDWRYLIFSMSFIIIQFYYSLLILRIHNLKVWSSGVTFFSMLPFSLHISILWLKTKVWIQPFL